VLSSPDGRTLLAEHNLSPCGVGVTSYFVPARGGVRTPVLPATDFADSAGIGWVDASHALVASSGFADCGDVAHGAIYLVNRNEPAPWNSELVVHTNGYDATLWGS
jgi:hypothetical protein